MQQLSKYGKQHYFDKRELLKILTSGFTVCGIAYQIGFENPQSFPGGSYRISLVTFTGNQAIATVKSMVRF